jgi:hypothetical protein
MIRDSKLSPQPYSLKDFKEGDDDEFRNAILIKAIELTFKCPFSQRNLAGREEILNKLGLVQIINGRMEFVFNQHPQSLDQPDEHSPTTKFSDSYENLWTSHGKAFALFLLEIIENQQKEKRIINFFDIRILEFLEDDKNVKISYIDVFQSNITNRECLVRTNFRCESSYISNINIAINTGVTFLIKNCNDHHSKTILKIRSRSDGIIKIDNSKFTKLEVGFSENRHGILHIINSDIYDISFNNSHLKYIYLSSSNIKNITGSSHVSYNFNINTSNINYIECSRATIANWEIESSSIEHGELPFSGIDTFKMIDVDVGAGGKQLSLVANRDALPIQNMNFQNIRANGPFRVRGWQLGTASFHNINLRHTMDFTGVEFLSEPNVGDIRLASFRGGDKPSRGVLSEIETGLRPIMRALETYGNFNAAYDLKRIEARIHGLSPMAEIGLAAWIVNRLYERLSDYGTDQNRPIYCIIILAIFFMTVGGASLIFCDGWVVTGRLSDISPILWLAERFLQFTPIGIIFESQDPAWVQAAPGTLMITRYLGIFLGSASYVLFFLFFLAIRRRYQLQ